MKSKLKIVFRKTLFLLLFSLIYLGIGFIIAILISNRYNYELQDIMTYEGMILFFIGILLSLKGNPSGININGIGQNNVNAISFQDLEVTRQEREANPYHKDYLKNNIVDFAFGNITVILGGILMFASSIIFF